MDDSGRAIKRAILEGKRCSIIARLSRSGWTCASDQFDRRLAATTGRASTQNELLSHQISG